MTENKGDLISREALKNELTRLRWTEENGFKNRYVLDEIIDNAPTVERPQGKKIKKKQYGWVCCSECDRVLGQQDNFCWNCGADVRGKNEN